MAIIGGETPTPEELPANYKRRVVVKFRPDVRLSYTTEAQRQFASTASRQWTELTAAHPGIALALLFNRAQHNCVRYRKRGRHNLHPFRRVSLNTSPSNVLPEWMPKRSRALSRRGLTLKLLRRSRPYSAACQSSRRSAQPRSTLRRHRTHRH